MEHAHTESSSESKHLRLKVEGVEMLDEIIHIHCRARRLDSHLHCLNNVSLVVRIKEKTARLRVRDQLKVIIITRH